MCEACAGWPSGWVTTEPLFQVPARGLDAQEGRQFSEVHADALTDADLAAMGLGERTDAEEWQQRIAEMERHPLDHEAAIRDDDCGAAAERRGP